MSEPTAQDIKDRIGDASQKYVVMDLDRGKHVEHVVMLSDCVDFMFQFLLPAYRRMGERRQAFATIINSGKAISFRFLRREQSNGWECRDWTMVFMFNVPTHREDEIRDKVMGAFRLWGVSKMETHTMRDRRGFYQVEVCELERVRGLV